MELMTKYQYTYFIYPFAIEEGKYKRYLQRLLQNKKCRVRFLINKKIFTYIHISYLILGSICFGHLD